MVCTGTPFYFHIRMYSYRTDREVTLVLLAVDQCFSTAESRHQLYRAARGSPGSCHFSFLSTFS